MRIASKKLRRREFTPGTAQCVVTTIRVVHDLKNFTSDNGDANAIERVLEEARCYGAAEIIERMSVVEDFEKASKILHTQRMREK